MVPLDSVTGQAVAVTLNGSLYRMRQLHSGDESRLQDFFASHSRETIRLRYGYTFTRLSRDRAHRLVEVDENGGVAFGIFSDEDGREVLHAVGRYCVETRQRAEVAFVVRESKRRCGMATALLRELGRFAELHGIQILRASVLRENYPMRRMLIRYRPSVMEDPDGRQLDYQINVRRLNRFVDHDHSR